MEVIKGDPLIKTYIKEVTVEIRKEINMSEIINKEILDDWYKGVKNSEFLSLNYNPTEKH